MADTYFNNQSGTPGVGYADPLRRFSGQPYGINPQETGMYDGGMPAPIGSTIGAPAVPAPSMSLVPPVTPGATPVAPGTTTAPTEQGWFGRNMDNGNIGDIAGMIGGFGQIWSGIQANNIAKETLSFQKSAFDTNLANQIQSYNTELGDRIKARYAQEGRPRGDAREYIQKNRL